jgi:site-specific recombinase XerD
MSFLNRLQVPPKSVTAIDEMLADFKRFMAEDRGFTADTIEYRCASARPLLKQLLEKNRSLEAISVSDVDSLLAAKLNAEHYARISIRSYASTLRSFFRYAELRGWCRPGIAAAIMAPRVFQQEMLPAGPTWEVVQAILDATAGDHPSAIRDHAMLMLFAVYGVHSREVARVQLSEIDWQRDRIMFTRSKGQLSRSSRCTLRSERRSFAT